MAINENKKTALGPLATRILAGSAGAIGTGGLWDQYSYHGQEWSKPRVLNLVKNMAIGGVGGATIAKGKALTGMTELAFGPPVTNTLVEAIPTMQTYQKSQKNVFDKFNDLSPLQKVLVGAGGLGVAAATVPAVHALVNLSRAAKHVADGRAVRLSTSIRKRRNQDKDLVIGVQPVLPEGMMIDSEGQPIDQVTQPQESKGFLSKIFG